MPKFYSLSLTDVTICNRIEWTAGQIKADLHIAGIKM